MNIMSNNKAKLNLNLNKNILSEQDKAAVNGNMILSYNNKGGKG